MFAIIEAYRSGLLKKSNLWRNILSGIIVGIVALPLSMAFAISSGMKPEQGLYTAIIAGLVVGILGGSRVQIAGPTGAFVIILAQITAEHGVQGLQIATLLAGIMLFLMGLFRLGSIIKFIPEPVIVGFTAGIGVVIFVGQWKDFFGLPLTLPLHVHFHEKILALLKALPNLNLANTGLGLLTILLVLLTPKFLKRIPGPLVAMLVATAFQYFANFKGVATIGSTFGGLPNTLPHFEWLPISLSNITRLLEPAFAIALLGAIESLLSATAADGMLSTRHHSNHELIGQGLANIIAPLFGGFAATGAIARTATNIRNGGNSPLAAIVHSLTLILIVIVLSPLAAYIPLASLAGILFVVAYNMSDIPHFFHTIKYAPKDDVFVLITTFLLTIFVDLIVAVNIGVIFAILFFMRKMILSVHIESKSSKELSATLALEGTQALPPDLMLYTIQGPFFFGAAEKIEHALSITHTDPKTIIFRMKEVPFIDATGMGTFKELITHFKKRGITVILCDVNQDVQSKLSKAGVLELIGKQYEFKSLKEALTAQIT